MVPGPLRGFKPRDEGRCFLERAHGEPEVDHTLLILEFGGYCLKDFVEARHDIYNVALKILQRRKKAVRFRPLRLRTRRLDSFSGNAAMAAALKHRRPRLLFQLASAPCR
jgi:hypothetical protein